MWLAGLDASRWWLVCGSTWISRDVQVGNASASWGDVNASICSPATDLSDFSDRQKAKWSTLCAAQWPCIETEKHSGQTLANGPLE